MHLVLWYQLCVHSPGVTHIVAQVEVLDLFAFQKDKFDSRNSLLIRETRLDNHYHSDLMACLH